jgi:aryl-alcohol dehydrogenase-like predicted oxidoreductase
MKYGKINAVDKKVSRIVLGTMIINTTDLEQSMELLDSAVELGCTTLDTAHIYGYGESERGIGKWFAERGNRDDVFLISKAAHPNMDRTRVTPCDITSDLNDSLTRLNTDYIDLYLLHRDDPLLPVGPIVEVLNEHLKAGKIKAFGGSNWTHKRIQEANIYAEQNGLVSFSASSPNFGLAEQVQDPWGYGCVTISGAQHEEAREWYKKTQMPVFAYSSLGRGLFSGRISRENYDEIKDTIDSACRRAYCYESNFERLDRVNTLAIEKGLSIPQIAMAYILNQPLNVYAIAGAANRSELESLAKIADVELTPKERAWLNLEIEEL